jgi:PAS domain S-box-containing protein
VDVGFQTTIVRCLVGIAAIAIAFGLRTKKRVPSEASTRELIERAPDAFFQADLDARFTDVNQAACRMLGYDRDELIGKTIFDTIPVEDAPRLKAVRADLLAPERVERGERMELLYLSR